jgi:hypothetical protein
MLAVVSQIRPRIEAVDFEGYQPMHSDHNDSYETVMTDDGKSRQTEYVAPDAVCLSADTGEKLHLITVAEETTTTLNRREGSRNLGVRVIVGVLLGIILGCLLQFSIDFFTWKGPYNTVTPFQFLYCEPKDPYAYSNFNTHLKDRYGASEASMKRAQTLYIQGMILVWLKEKNADIFQTTTLVAFLGAFTSYVISKKGFSFFH